MLAELAAVCPADVYDLRPHSGEADLVILSDDLFAAWNRSAYRG
jgi:hypothetical protein